MKQYRIEFEKKVESGQPVKNIVVYNVQDDQGAHDVLAMFAETHDMEDVAYIKLEVVK